MPPKGHKSGRQKESYMIVDPFVRLLRARGWKCHNITADSSMAGMGDFFCYNAELGLHRFIEFKHFKGKSCSCRITPAQKELFPVQFRAGVPLYVVGDFDLRGEENHRKRLGHYHRIISRPPNIMDLLDPNTKINIPIY